MFCTESEGKGTYEGRRGIAVPEVHFPVKHLAGFSAEVLSDLKGSVGASLTVAQDNGIPSAA